MKPLVLALALLVPSLASADRLVQGADHGSFDCGEDPVVVIHAAEGEFTFTGVCEKIVVNGADNKLTIANVKKLAIVGAGNTAGVGGVDKIGVTGSDNAVTYKGTTSGKGTTAVASVGTGNKIKKQ